MSLGFCGEVADFYHRYRRGYPPAVIDQMVETLGLGRNDLVVDLGCGTGQLTLPIAERVRAAVGMDPEPDMLAHGRRAASDLGVSNVTWMIGTDADLPALGALAGPRGIAAVAIGQALHWMDHASLFATVAKLTRAGGGVAVVTNGKPLWQQETDWSATLRRCLEEWMGGKSGSACGTDEESQQRYAEGLDAAGFEVLTRSVEYTAELDLEHLVGGVYSAFSVDRLPPPDQRERFEGLIRSALAPQVSFTETVRVRMLIGRSELS